MLPLFGILYGLGQFFELIIILILLSTIALIITSVVLNLRRPEPEMSDKKDC